MWMWVWFVGLALMPRVPWWSWTRNANRSRSAPRVSKPMLLYMCSMSPCSEHRELYCMNIFRTRFLLSIYIYIKCNIFQIRLFNYNTVYLKPPYTIWGGARHRLNQPLVRVIRSLVLWRRSLRYGDSRVFSAVFIKMCQRYLFCFTLICLLYHHYNDQFLVCSIYPYSSGLFH